VLNYGTAISDHIFSGLSVCPAIKCFLCFARCRTMMPENRHCVLPLRREGGGMGRPSSGPPRRQGNDAGRTTPKTLDTAKQGRAESVRRVSCSRCFSAGSHAALSDFGTGGHGSKAPHHRNGISVKGFPEFKKPDVVSGFWVACRKERIPVAGARPLGGAHQKERFPCRH
jgi:hypothetical protein